MGAKQPCYCRLLAVGNGNQPLTPPPLPRGGVNGPDLALPAIQPPGTGGSNPLPSSGESTANSISSIRARGRCIFGRGSEPDRRNRLIEGGWLDHFSRRRFCEASGIRKVNRVLSGGDATVRRRRGLWRSRKRSRGTSPQPNLHRPRHAVSSPGSLPPIRWAARSPGLAPARCAPSAEITPRVYDERPRLPVGLAVGAADQGPRACDSALRSDRNHRHRAAAVGPSVPIKLIR
jgi:hypothetical protein